jgi:hypothetical protein
MKKILLTFFLFSFLFFSPHISAVCNSDPTQPLEDESRGGTNGLVPCGNVQCCRIGHFFILLNNIYTFAWKYIATPLAILMLAIGGVMILISAGNPQLASKGKELIKWAIIGLVLVFGAWVIINFILTALGYKNIGSWNIF